MLNNMMDDFNTSYMIKDKKCNKVNLQIAVALTSQELDEASDELVEAIKPLSEEDAVKELIDTIYITAQQLRLMGVDVDAALAEVHRSNMSKALPLDGSVKLSDELEIARRRYPSAGIKEGQRKAVLMCGETNKVIKPTTYSAAVITPQMIGE